MQLKQLASDDLEGRGLGTHGLDVAADIVRDGFAAAGLDVTVVDGGAFQEFEVIAGSELLSPNELALVSPDGERLPLEYDADFRTLSFGATGTFSAPLVFCGYGIVATESLKIAGKEIERIIYDDFADIDINGKVAVILRRTPQQGVENGLFGGPHSGSSRHAALNTKLKNALSRGAAAVLFVNDTYSSRSELAKLEEQRAAAEQQVIDAATVLVSGEKAEPHAHGHGHPAHPHAKGTSQEKDDPHTKKPTPGDKPDNADGSVDVPVETPAETPADVGVKAASGPNDTKASSANPHNPHADPSPHAGSSSHAAHSSPHGHESPHGHGTLSADASLKAAVTHLQEVRKLIAEYDADPMIKFGYNGNRRGESIPVMQVKRSAMDGPVRAALGRSLEELEADIDATGKPHSEELTGWKAEGQTNLKISRVAVKNVIGVLPGRGPLAEETIVIGAHYDHLGRGGEGSLIPGSTEVHNGADDNASGTVALIELARRLASRTEPLPRRLVFIAFTGEERGLLGSAHYAKEPVFPIENTVAMFNMDMVGRLTDDKLTVFGTGTATRWDELLEQEAEIHGFALSKKPEGFGPSDHSSFYAKQIPVLHLFTGTHNDYHRPTDDWEKINFKGIGRVVDLLEELVVTTAETKERPQYVAVKGKADLKARSGSRPYFGSIPDFSGEEEGYAIQGVSPGSPADKAGLKGGDVIIKLGKHAITGLDDFDLALREFSPGEQVTVTVRRKGEEQQFRLTLATPR